MNSSNLTSTIDLFVNNPNVNYWRFQVVYTVGSMISSGFIDFMVNSVPQSGMCLISPLSGTTSTVFTITCSNWLDSNGIKDYSFYSRYCLLLNS